MIPADEKGFNSDTGVIQCLFETSCLSRYFYVMKQKQVKVKSQQSLQMKPRAADSIYSTSYVTSIPYKITITWSDNNSWSLSIYCSRRLYSR